MPAVPEATVSPVPHDRESSLGGHLPLKLGEHHDELHHSLAGGHGGVELLPQGDDVDIVFGKQRPQVHKVLETAGDAVELEADHQIDFARRDVPLEPLQLRAILVLGTFARVDVELQRLDLHVFTPLAELDLLLDLVLLCHEAVAFGSLSLR